ncbi:MAG: hypothetical protein U0228_29850 [Myxococcaceae bacterium]
MRVIPGFPIPTIPSPLPPKHRPEKKRVGLTIATVNDDFATPKTNAKQVHAGVVLMQEAKNVDLRRTLGDRFGVHQAKREDKAGAATFWRKQDRLKVMKRGYALGVEPHGAKMLARWINYTDMNVNGAKVRMISVHRPPLRFRRLWPEFDRNLAAFIKSSKLPVVVGMDANQRNPQQLARLTGLRWHAPKGSIDGFLASRSVHFERMKELPKGSSDHHPVLARITLKKSR